MVFATMLSVSGCSIGRKSQPGTVVESTAVQPGCREEDYSTRMERIGVLRSTDQGASWEFLGDACFRAPNLTPVDPSPLAFEDGVVLYFLDIISIINPGGNSTIYSAVTSDGMDFTQPTPAFGYPGVMTDPYILKLSDNTYRLYAAVSPDKGLATASSQDGIKFDVNKNVDLIPGATPDALLLPDNRIRLFVAGVDGITSLLSSSDGLTFSKESGVRIPPSEARVTDPHPIRLREGGYLMTFVVQPLGEFKTNRERLAALKMYLAKSSDGLTWTANPTPIGRGSVPGLVETADGTLYIYFVDVTYTWAPI